MRYSCSKVGLQLGVIPREGGKVVVGFGIQYQYTNTVFALGIFRNIQNSKCKNIYHRIFTVKNHRGRPVGRRK